MQIVGLAREVNLNYFELWPKDVRLVKIAKKTDTGLISLSKISQFSENTLDFYINLKTSWSPFKSCAPVSPAGRHLSLGVR